MPSGFPFLFDARDLGFGALAYTYRRHRRGPCEPDVGYILSMTCTRPVARASLLSTRATRSLIVVRGIPREVWALRKRRFQYGGFLLTSCDADFFIIHTSIARGHGF